MNDEYSVSQPQDDKIQFSVQHPSNTFVMPVEAARGFGKAILESTEGEDK